MKSGGVHLDDGAKNDQSEPLISAEPHTAQALRRHQERVKVAEAVYTPTEYSY